MRLFLALSENKEIYHTPKHKIRRINSKNKQIIKISWENKTTKTPNTLLNEHLSYWPLIFFQKQDNEQNIHSSEEKNNLEHRFCPC